jgi:DNA-directed RNA polymerase subunit beta'
VIVAENELITPDKARLIEGLGIDKFRVRSPITCQAPRGVCRLCYGMDWATGTLVEEGTAVGLLAAQSIGKPANDLVERIFNIGHTRDAGDAEASTREGGVVRYDHLEAAANDRGQRIALTRNGRITLLGPRGQEVESFPVPYGAMLLVEDGQWAQRDQVLCRWDPHSTLILADCGGEVQLKEIVEGKTLRKERDEAAGAERWVIMEHDGELYPEILIADEQGQILTSLYLPEKAFLEVREGQKMTAGTLLAMVERPWFIRDVIGGLAHLRETFEARRPRDPAVMAETAGNVRLGEKRRGKRSIWIQPTDDHGKPVGEEREHLVPHGKHLRVHTGDRVKKGDHLVFGPLVPHDILRILGLEAVQQHLLEQVQDNYRALRIEIDDKHVEIIIAQMLRRVKVETTGDTRLLPGILIDKAAFRAANDRLKECVKIKDPGDSKFKENHIVGKEVYEEERARLEAEGKDLPSFVPPAPATCSTQLLGITRAAVQSDCFISAASFQETTRVLTEAALAGKVDYLVGLKENVIMGHLVPAGTGFHNDRDVVIGQANAQTLSPAF